MKNNFAALAITLASSFLVAQEEVKKYEPILFQKGEEYVVPFKHKESLMIGLCHLERGFH